MESFYTHIFPKPCGNYNHILYDSTIFGAGKYFIQISESDFMYTRYIWHFYAINNTNQTNRFDDWSCSVDMENKST